MNTNIQIAKNTPSAIHKTSETQGVSPSWMVSMIRIERMAETDVENDQSPALKGMLLKDEIGRKRKNPPWSLVKSVIHELDPGYFNSFACLSVRGNNFVQCLCGFNGWHLGWLPIPRPGLRDNHHTHRAGRSSHP
jgi:hypothetical protein